MRTTKLILLLLGTFLISGYYPVETDEFNQNYSPVLMTRENLEKSVKYSSPKEMKNPGKIYLKDDLIFIVEKFRGIHVINNSDRTSPVRQGFINIPGCVDLAIKGQSLYADNAVDLVTIRINDLGNVRETSRVKNTFPELTPPGYDYVPHQYNVENRPKGTIIVAWEEK